MNEQQMQEYFEQHAVDGQLPDEEMVKLLTGAADGSVGDTGETGDNDTGDAPGPAEETTETKTEETAEAPKEEQTTAEPEEEPVITAKDGKNTIPYSELVEAREAAKQARADNETLAAEMKKLQDEMAVLKGMGVAGANAARRADEEAEAAEAAEDPLAALREDWPEVADAVDKITAAHRQTIAAQQEQIQALTQHLAPIQQSEAERQMAAHYTTILQAHPDADTLIDSKEFAAWREAQPSFVRDVQEAVLQRGTAEQVVELFDSFKAATGYNGGNTNAAAGDNAATQAQARQAAVQQARQQAKTSTPKSLSDIPGGAAVQTDPTETFLQMSETAQMDKIMGMSPDAIEAMLRRAT